MIPKKREDYFQNEGAGRSFEMNPRVPIEKDDLERQKPLIIDLSELNGQDGKKGAPTNFHRKGGRLLSSFRELMNTDDDKKDTFDIE